LAALKAAADNPEGSFTSAAAEAARSPAAETGPALAAPALAALGFSPLRYKDKLPHWRHN